MKKALIAFLSTLAALTAFAQGASTINGDRGRPVRVPPTVPVHVLTMRLGDDGTLDLLATREDSWWDLRPATAEQQTQALREPDSARNLRLAGLLAVTGSDASGHIVFRSIAQVPLKQQVEDSPVMPIHDPLFTLAVPVSVQVVSFEGWQPISHASFDLRKLSGFLPEIEAASCPQPAGPALILQQGKINIVVVAEGYMNTASDQALFKRDYGVFVANFLRTEPFHRYSFMFNINSVFATSCVEGAYHPPTCAAGARAGAQNWNSALKTSYCGDDATARLLYFDVNAWQANVAPKINGFPEIVVILVNDSTFGGSGGHFGSASFAVVAVRNNGTGPNAYFVQTVLHELGRYGFTAAASLGDEFTLNVGYPGCTTNCPANVVYSPGGPPTSIPWSRWLSTNSPVCDLSCTGGEEHVPGLFQGALGSNAYWRSEKECLMRHGFIEVDPGPTPNTPPNYFCNVCTDTLIRGLYTRFDPFILTSFLYPERSITNPNLNDLLPFSASSELVLGIDGFVDGPSDLTYTWRKGFRNGRVISGKTDRTYQYFTGLEGSGPITLEVSDPTPMVREDAGHPEPPNMHKFYTWEIIATSAPVVWEIHKILIPPIAPVPVPIPFPRRPIQVPQGTQTLHLRYSVKTSEVGRSGDQWYITVGFGGSGANALTAQSVLYHIEKTAANPQDNVTDQLVTVPIGDAARNGPVTVVTEVGGTAGETGDDVDLPTTVTAELYPEPIGCADQCDFCQAYPTDPSCPLTFSMSAEAVPIASTTRTYNGGDSTYSSLGKRIHEGRYVNITIPSPVKQTIQSIHFTADAVRTLDNVVLGRVRDTTWVPGGDADTSGVDDIHESVWALNISPKVQYTTENPSILNVTEDQWTHTIKYRITATITGVDGRIATSSAEVDTIISGLTPSDPVLLPRPLHALWPTPFTAPGTQNFWASIYMHNWLKFPHMALHIPDQIADEDAVDATPAGHEFGSGITEVPFYPGAEIYNGSNYSSGYASFRATAAKALDSNTNADRGPSQDIVRQWLTDTRAHLQAILPDPSVTEIRVGDGGACGNGFSDHLPDGWMKTLLTSGKVVDANGNPLMDLGVGEWSPPFIERLSYDCTENREINILLDRCRIGELTPGPCSTGRTIIARTAVTTAPVSASINSGQSLNLFVSATGENLRFQWYEGPLYTYAAPLSGEVSSQLTSELAVAPTESTSYWVLVSGDNGAVGAGATVTINGTDGPCTAAPVITSQPPVEQYVNATAAAYLAVTATGENRHYQWYQVDWYGNLILLSGATYPNYTTSNMGNYLVRVSNACGYVDSTVAYVMAGGNCFPPSGMYYGASSTSITVGQSITLGVVPQGTPPVSVSWFQVLPSDNIPVPAGSDPTITVTPPVDQTQYFATLGSDCGYLEMQPITINVCTPPAITQQPTLPPPFVLYGQTAMLTVQATGSNLHYHWTASGAGYGTDSPTLVIMALSSPVFYYCTVSNDCGTVDSIAVTVDPPCLDFTATVAPDSGSIVSGQSMTLTATSGGTGGLTYQWLQKLPSDSDFIVISGATGTSLVVSPTVDQTQYKVRITNCRTVESNVATITVTPCLPPSAITISGGGEIVRGQPMTLFANSTGTGIIYQWYLGSASDTSTPIYAGAQSINVTPQDRTNYWVRVTGTCGTRDSATVTVNVCTVPTIITQPQSGSIFSGNTATLSVVATVGTATPLTYQWYRGASGDTSNPVGAPSSSPSFTTPSLTAETSYWVAVSADICGPVLSDAATVSICPLAPTMTGAPDQSIHLGQTAHVEIGPFSPPNGNTFFWYQGASGDTSHPLGDFGGDWGVYDYIDVTPAVTTQYWAQVKNGSCVANTTTTTVSVCIPTITQQPAGLMINSGQTTTLTVAANTAGVTYQWYRGASGDTSAPVGTNSPSFTTPALTVATSYWVRVTGSCGQSVSSNTATITICQIPAITVQPPALTSLVRGYSTTLSVSATGTGLSYQWYIGTSGNTSSPVAGNSNLYTVTAPQNPTDYWVKIAGTCGSSVNSATAHISVCVTPTINTQPQSTYTFSGSSATLSVSASEAASETLHYQWHKGTTSPVNVGTDSPTYNTGALSADTSYYVTVTAGSAGLCSVDSSAATVSICMYPQTVTGAPNANSSPGQTVRLTIASNPGVTSYLWYRGVSGDTSNPISGWQAANYVDVAPTATTSYWAQWQANSGACITNTTTTTVSVCIPVITQQPGNVTIASGSTTLSVVSNLPGSTYQWYIGASGTTTSPISGATAASVTVSPGTTTSYWCRVSGSCGTANSNTATVTICSPPVITHQPTTSVAQSGQLNVLTVTATGTNLTYQWYMGASGDTSNPMSGRTTSTLQNNLTSSVQYWVKVSGTCGSLNSSSAWMSVPPGIISQPQQTTYVSQGSKGNLFVNAVGTGLHYQWWGDSGPVAGAADSPNFISPDVNATASYYCLITSSGGATTTSGAGSFYLCSGAPISSTTVTNPGGNCRYLISNVGGAYDSITWYQGQRGNTSVQVGTGSYLYVCPTTSTTYWFRASNTDSNLGVSCYADSATTTVP